jgi:hypothetical protein
VIFFIKFKRGRSAFVWCCYTNSHSILWEWWGWKLVSWQWLCVCATATWETKQELEQKSWVSIVIFKNCTWHFIRNTQLFQMDFSNLQNCVQTLYPSRCKRDSHGMGLCKYYVTGNCMVFFRSNLIRYAFLHFHILHNKFYMPSGSFFWQFHTISVSSRYLNYF